MKVFNILLILVTAACTLSNRPPETPTLEPSPTARLTATPVVIDARSTPQPTQASGTLPNCTPRTDWPVFTVPPGMTLLTMAFIGGISVEELAEANCLANPDSIFAGQTLRVPPTFPPTVPPEFENALPRAHVGLSPYLQFTGGWYEVQPGATVSLGWEPPLPPDVTSIEYYATAAGANQQPVLIAVDQNGGDNVWINWTVPPQFAGQITAIAYRGEAIFDQTDDPISVYTAIS